MPFRQLAKKKEMDYNKKERRIKQITRQYIDKLKDGNFL